MLDVAAAEADVEAAAAELLESSAAVLAVLANTSMTAGSSLGFNCCAAGHSTNRVVPSLPVNG